MKLKGDFMPGFVIEKHDFRGEELVEVKTKYLDKYPVVYMLYNQNQKKPSAYIGQTVQLDRRMKAHRKDKTRNKLTDTLVIGHKEFNQSATYNIETNLINHFIGDEKYKLQNVSQTATKQMHSYFKKDYYDEVLFEELWQYLYEQDLVENTSDVVRNKDIYKLSPFTALSPEQLEFKNDIITYCRENINTKTHKVFIVEGEAGTGKSVLMSSLFNTIQDLSKDHSKELYKTNNYMLVNHTEMQKTYQNMTESLPNMTKASVQKPTTFINRMEKDNLMADITLIDEAHLLLTKKDAFNNYLGDNHLEDIIQRSKVTVIIFDPKQFLKLKSLWQNDVLQKIKDKYDTTTLKLDYQFRMQGSYETNNWIDRFVSKKIDKLPPKDDDFELQIIPTAEYLKEKVNLLNDEYGLSRIVSTFDYEHKKNGDTYLVDPDGINLPWNTTVANLTWAERPETINEVGSIYTIQGFDLNYVGVVLGPSVDYDEEKRELVIDTSKYEDTEAFRGRGEMSDTDLEKAKERIILNSINVLLKRGIRGLYIYPVNINLRRKLLELQKERDNNEEAN